MKPLKSISAPNIALDIFNALQNRLVVLESKIKHESCDEEMSLFKDPERKKLVKVDELMDPIPLIFTNEEQEFIIRSIYPSVETGLMAYVYFCSCQDRWVMDVGLDIFNLELEGYKELMVDNVRKNLQTALSALDIFDKQKSAIASVFEVAKPLYEFAVKPLKSGLERCDVHTQIVCVQQNEPENESDQ